MPRVLIVAATTGYQTAAFAEAARQLGVDVLLATDRCHRLEDPWRDGAIAVRFEDPEASVAALRQHPRFDAVLAVGDRPLAVAAAYASQAGLPFHPPEAVRAARSKHLARERFREAGLPVPRFHRIPLTADAEAEAARAPYPCVLKPLCLSGSRGVIRADTPGEFRAAFRRIAAILDRPEIRRYRDESDRFIQVESYIPGREFSVEGLMTAGRLDILAVFEKPDPLEGPFFEETLYVTPPRVDVSRVRAAAVRAVHALGLAHGPVHAEFRMNESDVYPLEVAARPIGGLCARALRFPGGQTLEHIILRHALGENLSGLVPADAASGVMMIPIGAGGIYRGVEGEHAAAAVPGIFDVAITAKQGQEFEPLPEGRSYLGFLFAAGADSGAVEASLREAHGRLRFSWAEALRTL